MYEVAWMEINSKGHFVSKRKSFKSEHAMNLFISKLFEKDGFYRILATK